MNRVQRAFLMALLIGAAPRVARAQAAPARTPWSVFSARFDTHTSDFIYSVYGYGSEFGMVGVLYNPRSTFNELLVGGGHRLSLAGQTQLVAVAAAREDGLWYSQLYILPTVRVGHVWLRATSELDAPISSGGTLQYSLSPVSATVPVAGWLEVGAGADMGMARGSRTELDVGPEFRIALPSATLTVDGQRGLDATRNRLRIGFVAAF